jgi:beta-glucanase (GH16 family)
MAIAPNTKLFTTKHYHKLTTLFVVMKRMVLSLAFLAPLIAHSQQIQPDTVGGYKQVWADEFNKEGSPNPANWKFEHGFVRNHEDQWYQAANATCHNGLLVIEAKKVHLPNPAYVPNSTDWQTSRPFIEYTSACMNTGGLQSWQYGRLIMRGRINTDAGLWPAFWTLGLNNPWPSNGEIDIMEFYQDKLLANIACGTDAPYQAKWYSNVKKLDEFEPGWNQRFHTWRMDWDETSISLYVDDILLNHVALKDLVNQDGSNFNPFKQPHYILLNLAIGGDNGGEPSATTFPKRFEVDYVRVYQK